MIRNATNVIVVNESIKRSLEEYSSRKIDVIPIPIKLSLFKFSELARTTVRKELGLNDGAITIAYVGKFLAEKNVRTGT